jgi:hypothetical protein
MNIKWVVSTKKTLKKIAWKKMRCSNKVHMSDYLIVA